MTIEVLAVGKTASAEVAALTELYLKRVNRWVKCAFTVLPDVREKLPPEELKRREGDMLLRHFVAGDCVVLLDDKGVERTSPEFAAWMNKKMVAGVRRVVFVVGGAYGFSDEVYARADEKLSLSRMTFSHQIVRALFAEQLYRAFAIIHNEPYHHE
jgi:23S rRNA (pseudouridine1915-N3)-methyltransferase